MRQYKRTTLLALKKAMQAIPNYQRLWGASISMIKAHTYIIILYDLILYVCMYKYNTFRFTMVHALWASFFAVQFYSTKTQMEQCCRRRFVKYSSAVSWRLTKQRPSLCVSDELKYVAIPKDRKLQMSRFRTQSLRSKIASCSRTFSDSALCSKLRMAFAGRKETSVRPEQQNSTNKLDSRWMMLDA